MTFEKQRLLAAVMLTAACVPAFTYAQQSASSGTPPAPGTSALAPPSTLDALPGDARVDTAMAARIRRAIQADAVLRGTDISVNADHGVVSLTGNVRTREQSAVASAHAQAEDGVMRVDNDLAIPAQ